MVKIEKIPKIIHYCWFGEEPIPRKFRKYIDEWSSIMPEYRFIQWDERNYDIKSNPYIKQAYEAKKYAFVSDYVRLHVLYLHGGIYLDIDMKALKSLEDFTFNEAFLGFESEKSLGFAIIGVAKGNQLIKEVLELYEKREFICENGSHDIMTIVDFITPLFIERGLVFTGEIQNVAGFQVYPKDYFYPLDFWTKKMNITKNTYTIHMWAESWKSFPDRMKTQFQRVVGKNTMKKLSVFKKGIKQFF